MLQYLEMLLTGVITEEVAAEILEIEAMLEAEAEMIAGGY